MSGFEPTTSPIKQFCIVNKRGYVLDVCHSPNLLKSQIFETKIFKFRNNVQNIGAFTKSQMIEIQSCQIIFQLVWFHFDSKKVFLHKKRKKSTHHQLSFLHNNNGCFFLSLSLSLAHGYYTTMYVHNIIMHFSGRYVCVHIYNTNIWGCAFILVWRRGVKRPIKKRRKWERERVRVCVRWCEVSQCSKSGFVWRISHTHTHTLTHESTHIHHKYDSTPSPLSNTVDIFWNSLVP
jgi:hypothetical protein